MPENGRWLDAVADAILDGTPVDWLAVEAQVTAKERPLLERFKVLAAVATTHRDVPADSPAVAADHPSEPSGDGVTESRRWGHLILVELIGRGAFGEVYRARDTRLDRDVALKLLPAGAGPSRASSIIEEGRLLAQVRHLNVVTIYGAERIGDRIGLWMELVEGRTLEERLKERERLTVAETVAIGVQLCGAVAAVHAAGLLHRDIKAQNVMLADDGRVVLMDFGTGWEAKDTIRATPAGTPLYLAPEVLAGEAATVRSDIYALGVLLYHLLTGTYPVSAGSIDELRAAHAHQQRVSLRTARTDIPAHLLVTVERAIDPRPERRYQTATALATELRRSQTRVSKFSWAALFLFSLAVGTLAAVPALKGTDAISTSESRSAAKLAVMPVTSLPGEKRYPALSPDGTRVAFGWARDGQWGLYVLHLTTNAISQVTEAQEGVFPAWSPDGRLLASYSRFRDDAGNGIAALRITPVDGGKARILWQMPTLLMADGLDWSPDGKHLALSARASVSEPFRIVLLDVDTLEKRWITTPRPPSSGDSRPAFSTDGASIAFIRRGELHVLHLPTGNLRRLPMDDHDIQSITWDTGDHTLIFLSYRGGARDTLWRVSASGGEPEQVAGIGEGASSPSVARHAARMVYLQRLLDSNLYLTPLSDHGRSSPERLAQSNRIENSPDLSPDGTRIAFTSNRSGRPEVWVADSDGSNTRRLTQLNNCGSPRWSPDGLYIAASVRRTTGESDVYVIDAATGASRRVVSGTAGDGWPTWSADGRHIYFHSLRSGTREIWKVDVRGGQPIQVTKGGGMKAWESNDGRTLYFSSDNPTAIWRMLLPGGLPSLVLPLPAETNYGGEWVLGDSGIYWYNWSAPRPAIELFSFATGRSVPVFELPGPYDVGSSFSVARDGKWIVFAQRDYHSVDVMLVDGFGRR